MIKLLTLLASIALLSTNEVFAQELYAKSDLHELNPSAKTVVWGYYWAETKPVLHIKSGDRVKIHTLISNTPGRLEAMGILPDQLEQELRNIQSVRNRGPGPHILTGPIFIEDAEPGDVLEVRIQSIELPISYGYNLIGRNGFLSDEIFVRGARIIRLEKEKGVAHFAHGIEIPLRPFFGSMGVAPPREVGRISSAPPWIHAGNLDNKELVAGTTLWIPIHVKGALFHAGDGHAAQGNGEVDLTAIETSLIGLFQFIVHKDITLAWPRAETSTHIITMGMDRNLTTATKIAVREMISYLESMHNLSEEEAYRLTSIAVDLNITQLVDGNKGVHAMLPKEIFVSNKKN